MNKILTTLLLLIPHLIFAQSFSFTPNKGQFHPDVMFRSRIPSGELYLLQNGLSYSFYDSQTLHNLHDKYHQGIPLDNVSMKISSLKVTFINADNKSFIPTKELKNYENYYLGKDKTKWASKVPLYQSVQYSNLYPGIDLRLYDASGFLKYDFILKPGADPSQIRMKYEGAKKLSIDRMGNLLIDNHIFLIKEQTPVAWQLNGSDTIKIPCEFVLNDNNVSFRFTSELRKDLPLIIDPQLIFSTYSGSFADNFGYTATYDSRGYLYAGGNVFGVGYQTTPGAFQMNYNPGWNDVAISKYDTTGTSLIYSTYLGGSGSENPHSMIVNNYDELFVLGTTGSSDFPMTANAYDNSFNGGPNVNQIYSFNYPQGTDMFVSRFSADGSQLNASTYLGGTGTDGLNTAAVLNHNYADIARGEIDIDENNFVFIASSTASLDFPGTSSGFQPTYGGGGQDGVIVKMDNGLTTLVWSSYLGGSQNDAVYSLAIDPTDQIVVTGGTFSTNFPTNGSSFTTHNGDADALIAKISPNGNTVIKSSLYGSNVYDQAYFVETDRESNVYIFGQTNAGGNSFIVNAGYFNTGGNQFITKFNPGIDTLLWSTAFGNGNGHADISPTAFLVDVCNKIYVSGWGGLTNSQTGFVAGSTTTGLDITPDAFQATTDGSDFYLMVMDADANNLIYGTYFGGPISHEHVDGGTSRFNRRSEIYQSVCAGCGSNDDFPIAPANAWSPTNNSANCNNGVFKFKFDFPGTIADFQLPPSVCAPDSITLQNLSTGANQYFWDLGNGQTSTAASPTFQITNPGTYTIRLVVVDSTGLTCNVRDTVVKQFIAIGNNPLDSLDQIIVCDGSSTIIGVSPSGDPSLTFSWSPSTGLSDPAAPNPVFIGNTSTDYQLIISNGLCSDTVRQSVIVSPLPSVSLNDTIVCSGTTLNIGFQNPVPNASYQWLSPAGLSNPSIYNPQLTVNSNTLTSVLITLGTCSDTVSRTINILNIQSVNPSDTAICPGDTITITDIPLFNGITYQWIPATGLSNASIHNPQAYPSQSQEYTIILSNNVCTDTVTKFIDVISFPALAGSDTTICPSDSVLIGPSVVYPNILYSWSPSAGLSSASVPNPYAAPDVSTSYILTIESALSPGSCLNSDTVTIDIFAAGAGGFTVTEQVGCNGVFLTLNNNGVTGASYVWLLSTGQTSTQYSPTFEVPFDTTISITYVISLGECSDTLKYTQSIKTAAEYFGQLQIPNVFTPFDGNGLNDCFAPTGIQAGCYDIMVFNRWGNKAFDSILENEACWDGKWFKTNQKSSPGVYFYIIKVGSSEYHGTVHLADE